MSDEEKPSDSRRSARVPRASRKKAEEAAEERKKQKEEAGSDFDESEDEDSDDSVVDPPAFGPAALGLHRVGDELPKRPKKKPIQALNARGMPARIRKKNPLFYDKEMVTDKLSPSKGDKEKEKEKEKPTKGAAKAAPAKRKSTAGGMPKAAKRGRAPVVIKKEKGVEAEEEATPPEEETTSGDEEGEPEEEEGAMEAPSVVPVDKRIGQLIGQRLRNLLKLPKAHKFISFEFFYSTMDKALLDAESDFELCLRERFPTLVTRLLTRPEWNKLRKILGKPRRCSQAFFNEERRELERRRQKVRLLQTKKTGDPSFVRDLPKNIPGPLTVGCKVTARLRAPQDGLFTGTIDAVDPLTNSYRISFDRVGLGTHTIPDYETAANEPVDMIPLASMTIDFRPKPNVALYMISPLRKAGPMSSISRHDPLLGGGSYPSLQRPKQITLPKDSINGFSVKLLELMVRSKKSLGVKRTKLVQLRKMNGEAEIAKARDDLLTEDFQKRYAGLVVSMEKINRDIQTHLSELQAFCKDLTTDSNVLAMLAPSYMREKCRELAFQIVERNNPNTISDDAMLKLITELTTVMWVASYLNNNDQYGNVLNVLEGCLEETKTGLYAENAAIFERHVHTHIRHIQLDLGHAVGGGEEEMITGDKPTGGQTVSAAAS